MGTEIVKNYFMTADVDLICEFYLYYYLIKKESIEALKQYYLNFIEIKF